jgi:hypothetical protein
MAAGVSAGRRLSVLGVVVVLASTGLTAVPAAAAEADAHGFSRQVRVGFQSGDDWEPAIAADRFGHEYVLYKHYDVAGGGTCPGCDVHLLVQRSSDSGRTWTAPRPIAPVAVDGGQYDSQIMVDPVDGRTVWASFLQNATSVIAVVRSADFGETWSPLRVVSDRPPGLDKDTLVVRGRVVAVAYNDGFNSFASVSLDGGEHWTTHLMTAGDDQFNLPLSAGGGIDSTGAIYFAWNSFDAAHSTNGDGPVTLWMTKSVDGGQSWQRTIVDVSGAPPPCPNCGFAYLSAQMTMQIGPDDTIYLLWNGTRSRENFVPERIFFSWSTNRGATFSPRREVSTAAVGVAHCFPALAVGRRPGDVRLAWMDTRTGAWNVFYRQSHDGGRTLDATRRVSGEVPGYGYLTSRGFSLPYGDYFEMVVDSENLTQIAFGEGPSYAGPGNIWVSHQLSG